MKREKLNNFISLMIVLALVPACGQVKKMHTANEDANKIADEALYKAVEYENKAFPGPALIVLPGQVKSMHASFREKVTANSIADFAEFELSRANFKVLERSDLGPLLNEITLAANLGDRNALRKHIRGKFKTTKWFVKFDILKAEPVAEAESGFDGKALGSLISQLTQTPAVQTGMGSVQSKQTAKIWIIGLRYKVINANTTEQVTGGYFEQKMEIGSNANSFLGLSNSIKKIVGLDTMTHRLVTQAVADLDKQKGKPPAKKVYLKRAAIKKYQTQLNQLNYNTGVPDGFFGRKTAKALRAYQKDRKLKTTGVFDQYTIIALDKEAEEAEKTTVTSTTVTK